MASWAPRTEPAVLGLPLMVWTVATLMLETRRDDVLTDTRPTEIVAPSLAPPWNWNAGPFGFELTETYCRTLMKAVALTSTVPAEGLKLTVTPSKLNAEANTPAVVPSVKICESCEYEAVPDVKKLTTRPWRVELS